METATEKTTDQPGHELRGVQKLPYLAEVPERPWIAYDGTEVWIDAEESAAQAAAGGTFGTQRRKRQAEAA